MTAAQSHEGTHLGRWLQSVQSLVRTTGARPDNLPYLEQLAREHPAVTRVAVLGAPNAGKSNLLNGLFARRLLPVSSLHVSPVFRIEPSEPDQPEHYTCAGASLLLADPPTFTAELVGQPVTLHVNDAWLAARKISIAEKPALDAPDTEVPAAISAGLRGADLVLLVIDAQMPVRRSETVVLSECARRGLPVIAVLTKTDRLLPEDRVQVSEYVKKQIQAYSPAVALVEVAVSPSGATGIEQLKEAIDDVLAAADFSTIRLRQAAEEFLAAVALISAAANAALALQDRTAAERSTEVRRRRLAADEQASLWAAIENQLQARRHNLDDKIRQGLDLRRESIAEMLMHDMEGRTDIKAWWERELPYRLNRELRAAAESLSATANRQISGDIRWLQEELTRTFHLPQAAVAVDASVDLDGGELASKDIDLRDTNKMRIVTRVGQAAAVVMAGRLLFTAGLSGATIGLSVLAGLAAEQVIVYAAKKDREKVRGYLDGVIQKASLEYALDVSRKLKAGYDEIVEALRQQQQRWQRAQDAALQMVQAPAAKETDWRSAADAAKSLEREIRAAIAN